MKIVRLESENIKRLHAVEIKPDGSLVIIGGKNAQGKTSVLDSIEYALGGTKSIPSKPIHKGKEKAKVVVEFDDIIVTRTFSESGSKLVVADKNGFTKPSPQALLDSLVGRLSFDPLSFIKMKSDEQLKITKELAGIDFSELDREVNEIYEERTIRNRNIKSLRSQLQAIPEYEDIPEKEILVTELVKELEEKTKVNQFNQKVKDSLSDIEEQIEKHTIDMDNLRTEIKKLREKWDKSVEKLEDLKNQKETKLVEIFNLSDEDIESIRSQISQAEEINQKVRSKNNYKKLSSEYKVDQIIVEKITKRLSEIEEEKKSLISSSKLPIQGLTFDSSTLFYNGIPFAEQSSSAEQLRVSVAMGFAMNPKLKILLIRDGSLLDEDNLKMIAEMAEKEGGQLWLEKVGEGKECQVIIEDGRVKE